MRASVSGSKTKFHVALRKTEFRWRIIDRAKSIEQLRKLERKYISELGTLMYGYNSSVGGEMSISETVYVDASGQEIKRYTPSEAGRNVGQNITASGAGGGAGSGGKPPCPETTAESRSEFRQERRKRRLEARAQKKKDRENGIIRETKNSRVYRASDYRRTAS